MNNPRNINEARTLANIADRAARITEDYRLVWNRREGAFFVAHKTDRARRYAVTAEKCSCPSTSNYGNCKHHIGLPALIEVEIARYKLLGFAEDLARVEAFAEEVENAAMWSNPAYLAEMERTFCPEVYYA